MTQGPEKAPVGSSRLQALFVGAVSLLGIAVAVLTVKDYGVTWDEGVHSRHGELALSYFLSGFQDRRVLGFLDLDVYGPVFDLGAALLYRNHPEHKYLVRHVLIAVCALGAIPALALLVRQAGRPWLVPLSLAALFTMPRFYGDCFNNPKDLPFACAVLWSMAAMLRLTRCGWARWRDVAWAGTSLGAALALRPGGLPFLAAYALVAVGLAVLARPRAERWRLPRPGTMGRVGVLVGIAWVLMVAAWPWALQSPLLNPVRAVATAMRFTTSYPVLFEGRTWSSSALPGRYLAEFLAITTPPPIMVLALVGVVVTFVAWWRDRAGGVGQLGVLATAWLVAPVAGFSLLRPNVYDGIRHFLFALPALAVLAALGADWGVEQVRRRARPAVTRAAAAALGAVLLLPLVDLVELHPYQQTYFNGLVGGVSGASGRYETDYWLSSYKEAMEWINAQAARAPAKLKVLVATDSYGVPCAATFRGPNVDLAFVAQEGLGGDLPDGVDYYVATTRYGWDANFPSAPRVFAVERQGAVFTVVKGRSVQGRTDG